MSDELELDRRAAKSWLGTSVAVLVVAGLLALLLVIARMPPFDRLVTDPLFFRRCLVVHVVLSIVLWFQSFTAALFHLLPARRKAMALTALGPWLARAGIVLLVSGAFLPGTQAVLANYIPVIDHPLFAVGLATFFAGVAASAASRDLTGGVARRPFLWAPPGALSALRVAAVGLLLALATLFGTWRGLPEGLEVTTHYELLFWGAGHVLQLVSVAALIACWKLMLPVPPDPAGERVERFWLAVLLIPWLAAPVLTFWGASTSTYHTGFTRLMQFALAPTVLVFLYRGTRALCSGAGDRAARIGFVTSAVLTLIGFGLGACISGSTTIVPGHYHANIGAVTTAFMAVAYRMIRPLGIAEPSAWLARLSAWQPALYGAGQAVFALGFALAGAHGAARKSYGAEQIQRGPLESAGLFVMGIGGFVAIAGGVLFLLVLGRALWRRARTVSVQPAAAAAVALDR